MMTSAKYRGAIPSAQTQRKLVSLLILVALAFSLPAVAAETADTLDTIVVTGARTSSDLGEIPSSISVISLADIEATNAVTVTDLLQNLAGVHVVQPSGQGGVARVFVRGGDQNLTLIMVDGVRVNDPMDSRGSAFDFSTLNMNDIERIEIVRGPHSAVYGSDSLAGVINIITKSQIDELGGALYAEAGMDDFLRGALDVSGPVGDRGGFVLRVASKDDGEPVTGTTFSGTSVSARLSFAESDRWNMRLFGNYSDNEGTAFPEDSGGSRLAVLRDVDTRSAEDFTFGFSGGFDITDRWHLNVLATSYDHDSSYFSPGVAPGVRDPVPPNGGDATLKRADLAVNAVVELNENLITTIGVDYYDEDGVSDGFVEFAPGFKLPAGYEFDRKVTGAFAELHYKSEVGPTLLASVRSDNPNEESSETTSKLGFIYDFDNRRTSIQGNWGQGFALPGFFSLASPLVGNPELRPETSTSMDLGVTHWFVEGRIGATVTIFRNEFNDLIDFDSSVFQMVNLERLDVDGAELQISWQLQNELQLSAHVTYLDMELQDSDSPLRQRPDWRGGVSMRWSPAEAWLIDASWLSIGETFDSSIPTGDMYLDGYNRIDATLTYRGFDRLNVLLSVDNVLDEDYEQAIGFPSPGARARLGVRMTF
jgi:outer membrane cobalamin receptor